jgi:hypothetical protein
MATLPVRAPGRGLVSDRPGARAAREGKAVAYEDKNEDELLRSAAVALKTAACLPPRSPERELWFGVHEGYMAELERRAIRHVLQKLGREDLLDGPADAEGLAGEGSSAG